MGTPDFAVPVLRRLLDAGHEVVGVYTQPDKPAGRGKRTKATPVKAFAEERGLSIFQPKSLRRPEPQAEFAALRPDAAVVAAYGKLLPPAVLDAPRLGCINIHPSLLPKHRGASPVAAAIIGGDETTGVTVMMLDEGLDTGPLLAQRQTPIGEHEEADALTARLLGMGADLLVEVLPELAAGRIAPIPQDDSQATVTTRLTRQDGRIDWTEPAERIARMVRAYHPWPGTFTSWNGRTVKVIAASPTAKGGDDDGAPGTVTVRDGGLTVATGEGALAVTRLQMEGRRAVSAAEFTSGHPGFAGAVLGG